MNEPHVETRAAQPYAAIRRSVGLDGLTAAVDQAFPPLFGWLAGQSVAVAAAPFIRYVVIDMPGRLDIELGVPAAVTAGDGGDIQPGLLPAGRYAVLRHVGPFDGLIGANAALLDWAREQGLTLDCWDTDEGTAWRSRVEHYLTDPSAEPDPAKWETEIACLTRES